MGLSDEGGWEKAAVHWLLLAALARHRPCPAAHACRPRAVPTRWRAPDWGSAFLASLVLSSPPWTAAGQVVDGLDQAVMKMKEGERALVTVAPQYGFGEQASKSKEKSKQRRQPGARRQATRAAPRLHTHPVFPACPRLPPRRAGLGAAAGGGAGRQHGGV